MGRLALVQSRSVRGGFAVPWQRVGTIALGVALVLALLYLAARETPVFAVRAVQVTGGPGPVRAAVREAAQPFEGKSLVALDGEALVSELEALPSVRSASYDRAFPSTLRVFIRPERPLGILKLGEDRWVISERGRIIRRATPELGLPRFRVPDRSGVIPGAFITETSARTMLSALADVPDRFPARIDTVRLQGGRLKMELRAPWGSPELRLGEPVDLDVKLAVAAVVLRSLSVDERASAGYIDVSVPERTVVGTNPQVEG